MSSPDQDPKPVTAPQTFAQIFNPERVSGAKNEAAQVAPEAADDKPVDPVAAKLAPRAMKNVSVAGEMTLPPLPEEGAEAVAGAGLPGAGTRLPLPGAGDVPAGDGVTARALPGTMDGRLSEGAMQRSNAASWLRASGLVLKWGGYVGIALAGCFAAGKYVVFPLISELQASKQGGDVVVDKNASAPEQVLQQTRQVVAKNNAKVDRLKAIVEDQPAVKQAKAVATAKAEKTPEVKAAPPAVVVATLLEQQLEALAGYQITGARHAFGEEARILLDGRMVKFGEIIDPKLGLRFMGLDVTQEFALFTTGSNEVLSKRVEANRDQPAAKN